MKNNKQYKNTFGLDLSDLSLKITQLRKSGDKIKVQAIGKYKLKKGIISKGVINDSEALVKAIKEAMKKPEVGSINTSHVVASLPETESFLKLIEIDKTPNPLEDIIGQEIEKYFPTNTNNIYYDYEIIKKTNTTYSVLIGACSKEVVDSYINTFKQAGLSIVAFETESIAVARCLLQEESPKYKSKENSAYAIIDIGAIESFMVIYANNSIISSIALPIKGEDITGKIASTLEISNSQAEKAKIICGLDSDKAQGIISDILSEVILDTTNRIREIIDYYENNYTDLPKISKIILSGGGSNVKHLSKILSDSLSIKTIKGNIFININDDIDKYNESFTKNHNITLNLGASKNKKSKSKKSTLSSKHDSSLDYATAMGLALRNFFI